MLTTTMRSRKPAALRWTGYMLVNNFWRRKTRKEFISAEKTFGESGQVGKRIGELNPSQETPITALDPLQSCLELSHEF
jgi:hypothetical protein